MGLTGPKREEQMKVEKKRKTAEEKSAPVNRAAFRIMWCCTMIPQEMGKLKQCGAYWFLCVCLCLSVSVLHHTFLRHPHALHVSSKAN